MTSENNRTTVPKPTYRATMAGLVAGLVLGYFLHPVCYVLLPLVAFLLIDRVKYKKASKEYNLMLLKKQEEERLKALEEQRIKETKKLERQIKAEQKKNREDKSSLYKNIYTVAGIVLANQQDLKPYIKNAEDVIAHFRVSDEDRYIAVEAFNSALDPNYDVEDYVYRYMSTIGKNRDYINCVLTYALMIASVDGVIHYDAKDRLVQIAKALGSSDAALKRLFKSNGAEARFAREFDEKEKKNSKNSLAQAMLNLDENITSEASGSTPVVNEKTKRRSTRKTKSSQKNSQADTNQNSKDYTNQSGNENYSSGANEEQSSYSNSKESSDDNTTHSEDYNRINEALEILGLTSKATFDDLKRAHKKMMLKYHPDRLASQGLPEDMIVVYTEKAKAVQVAFEYLRDLYNEFA